MSSVSWWLGAESTRAEDAFIRNETKAYSIRNESTFLRFELSSPCAKFHRLSDVEY